LSAFAWSDTCNNVRAVIHALPCVKRACAARDSLHYEPRVFIDKD